MLQGLVKQLDRDIYYKDNEYHNENGPAVIEYYADGSIRTQFYYINGKLHREDGPALICFLPSLLPTHGGDYVSREYYYINGKWVSKPKWLSIYKPEEYLKRVLEKTHKLPFAGKYQIDYMSNDKSIITFKRI